MQFSKNLEDNLEHLKRTLSLEKNFDVVYRVIAVGGKKGCLLFVDGLTKDEVLLKVLQAWWSIKPEDLPADAHGFSKKYMPYGEVGLIANEEDMIVQLLSGITAVLIDGYDKCLMLDCRTYPARGVGEPEKDKVLRGSRGSWRRSFSIRLSSAAGSATRSSLWKFCLRATAPIRTLPSAIWKEEWMRNS